MRPSHASSVCPPLQPRTRVSRVGPAGLALFGRDRPDRGVRGVRSLGNPRVCFGTCGRDDPPKPAIPASEDGPPALGLRRYPSITYHHPLARLSCPSWAFLFATATHGVSRSAPCGPARLGRHGRPGPASQTLRDPASRRSCRLWARETTIGNPRDMVFICRLSWHRATRPCVSLQRPAMPGMKHPNIQPVWCPLHI